MCLALVLATPTRSLSGDAEQAPNAPPTEAEVESVTIEIGSRMFVPKDRKSVV